MNCGLFLCIGEKYEKNITEQKKKDITYHPEMHIRDVNSREIFKNDKLTSQFLKNYTNIPLFANIKPEDVKDVSKKYRAFLGVEYESDTVKKVCIRREDGSFEREVYVISLIEHKSDIDYDVAMQLLRYMTVIWHDYKKMQNKKMEGSSRRKDFMYQVVSVNEYTNEELSRKQDEMSLVMLINKIQTPEDYNEFRKVSAELIDSIYGNAPEKIKEIYRDILWSLLMKMNVPSADAEEMMGEIGGRGMGYLFENMEKMDIQAERRNTQREKKRADEAGNKPYLKILT